MPIKTGSACLVHVERTTYNFRNTIGIQREKIVNDALDTRCLGVRIWSARNSTGAALIVKTTAGQSILNDLEHRYTEASNLNCLLFTPRAPASHARRYVSAAFAMSTMPCSTAAGRHARRRSGRVAGRSSRLD